MLHNVGIYKTLISPQENPLDFCLVVSFVLRFFFDLDLFYIFLLLFLSLYLVDLEVYIIYIFFF